MAGTSPVSETSRRIGHALIRRVWASGSQLVPRPPPDAERPNTPTVPGVGRVLEELRGGTGGSPSPALRPLRPCPPTSSTSSTLCDQACRSKQRHGAPGIGAQRRGTGVDVLPTGHVGMLCHEPAALRAFLPRGGKRDALLGRSADRAAGYPSRPPVAWPRWRRPVPVSSSAVGITQPQWRSSASTGSRCCGIGRRAATASSTAVWSAKTGTQDIARTYRAAVTESAPSSVFEGRAGT